MKWYWILAIVVGALLIGGGISFAINGGGATLRIGKTGNGGNGESGPAAEAGGGGAAAVTES